MSSPQKTEEELHTFLKKCGLSQSVLEKEVIPVLRKMEVSNEILLRSFCWSERVRTLAKKLGMSSESINKIIYQCKKTGLSSGDFRVLAGKGNSRRSLFLPLVLVFLSFVALVGTYSSVFSFGDSRPGSGFFDWDGLGLEEHKRHIPGEEICNLSKSQEEDLKRVQYDSVVRTRLETNTPFTDLDVKAGGIVCVSDAADVGEDISKLFDLTMYGIYYAKQNGLTFMVPRLMSQAYAVGKFQNLYPTETEKVIIYFLDGYCEGKMTARKKFKSTKITTQKLLQESKPDFNFKRAFYENIWPRKEIVNVVDAYLEKYFGNGPFAAVQLLSGNCEKEMTAAGLNPRMCSPKRDFAMHIVSQFVNDRPLPPLFVLSDGQNGNALTTYKTENDFQFDKLCTRTTFICSIIRLEISARSNIFLGAKTSPISVTVSRLRAHRQLRTGVFYPNILQYSPEIELEEFYGSWYNITEWSFIHKSGKKKQDPSKLLDLKEEDLYLDPYEELDMEEAEALKEESGKK
mmetsp:Transcript_30093/g.37096  ORF Transcript_30093/g.37096 Transcript_30093/m.37096 type:complete len:515 (+) Transcript_30093:230-1774(+)|eukprot:CAMPEP_0204825652 /NCGR_PEP_ID=MMETSP1346-20131115/3500_1 /ASSEMBLY_ACC=CAM_ASM_000771 /TAXON_ID=215587 /ORGANISM="Aplanochytrium stocchinoi, Strain GSBS06" /LENGTH=514 /DNA_ID=CAMNT_0051953361 /DNA_START=152 /DNA_END=1696 /DNA_ORIENTATION=-